jgi:hypothetical protein
MTDDTFERDLRSVISSRVPAVAPASLRAVVLEASTGRRSWVDGVRDASMRPFRSVLSGIAALAAVALVVVFVAGLVGYALNRSADVGGSGEVPPAAVQWQTETVSLAAGAIVIDAGSQRFVGSPEVNLSSDPGDPGYATLEATWRERGAEMRLSLDLAADETTWWVTEIRTYDGRATGVADWITYRGTFFRTDLGEPYLGDVDLSSTEGQVAGRLRIDDLRLAFVPFVASSLQDCRPAAAFDPGDPEADGPPVAQPGLGIDASMTPHQVGAILVRAGVCHTFRLMWMFSGSSNQGYSQTWCRPPEGDVTQFATGSQGELIVFVRTEPRSSDPSVQSTVGC